MIYNPLPDYLADEDKIIYDVDIPEDEINDKSIFFRKIKHRIGGIVILINALERIIENCILEIMNPRCEDSRIWILMKDSNFDKKIKYLNDLYIESIRVCEDNNQILINKIQQLFLKLENIRKKRNLYVHSNWLNNYNLQYFETKVKKVEGKNGYYRERRIIHIKDLDQYILDIEAVANDLETFQDELELYE